MAPEVMVDAVYDERADLWSVGCVLYQAMFGKPPIRTESFQDLMKWLKKPEIVWPEMANDECKSFLKGLLEKDSKMRHTWSEILDHPYVKNNLIILESREAFSPLTQTLTSSQQVRKQKQRDEIIFQRGKKMIAEAMSKCPQLKLPTDGGDQKAAKKEKNVIDDNESISSADSINAIIQTDLETDVEGPMIKKPVPPIKPERIDNQNLVIKRYTENFANAAVIEPADDENANLKIGTMLDNFQNLQLEDEAKWLAMKAEKVAAKPCEDRAINEESAEKQTSNSQSNIDLVKRKLSQNLDNFSIRLNNSPANVEKSGEEFDKDDTNEKTGDSKMDTYEDQCSPIENEEWLAFIHMTMQEVLNKEIDTLKHHNLVRILDTMTF